MHFSSEVDENLGINKNKAFVPLRKTLPEMVRTTCLKVSDWLFTHNRSASQHTSHPPVLESHYLETVRTY